jgi:hypothetical protein
MAAKVTDRRSNKRPIFRCKLAQQSWADGETDAIDVEIPICGILNQYATKVSDNTGNKTMTVSIYDEDDQLLYTAAGIAENATTVTKLTADTEVCIPAGSYCKMTPSGDPGVSGLTVDVTLIGK